MGRKILKNWEKTPKNVGDIWKDVGKILQKIWGKRSPKTGKIRKKCGKKLLEKRGKNPKNVGKKILKNVRKS